jgi:hypothetical protein
MNMIYNSAGFCVVEFRDPAGGIGGYEIMDKVGRRELFLGGDLAIRFRQGVEQLIGQSPSVEEVDEYLSGFQGLMQVPVLLH